MDDQRGLRTGHLLALGGAGLALAALWAPWYQLHLGALQDALQQRGVLGTPVGNVLQSLTALLPRSIDGNGWQVLQRIDVLVALLTVSAAGALLAAAGAFGDGIRVAREAAARICIGAGVAGALAVGGRVLNPPGPNEFIDVRWGAWACLIGCVAMAIGGTLALGEPDAAPFAAPAR